MKIKKVLILGSGALKIGQAGEFDYSGSQAIKALKEEKIETVLINPNIATVQTSKDFADIVYFLPVEDYFVEKVIEKEKPDAILLSFGGQTALNCGVSLNKKGIFKKHNVQVIGTPVETIEITEDRELFKKALNEIDVKTPRSFACKNMEEANKAVKEIEFPVMIRGAYSLGGKGSGVAKNKKTFKHIAEKALASNPQILVEEYLGGWKEIEYEVVRDSRDNCITVCNMENFDPMGIHTGESIVIAPTQTLTNEEYHNLRELSIRVIRHLGIVGECNIQYALDPETFDYRVIEVNARLSRSSALASKATGYPLAYIAAKLALNKSLVELRNSVTEKTTACFEPALDYCVIKMPRWDLEKFPRVEFEIGSEMKSVGEVMSIGRNFEETIQKAVRMLNNVRGLSNNIFTFKNLERNLKQPTDRRLFAIINALHSGMTIDKLYKLTKVDKWFLYKLKNIVEMEKHIKKKGKLSEISKEELLEIKKLGFSDKQIGEFVSANENEVRTARKKMNVIPYVKQIDTLAAEYPATTNYLYLTYHADKHDIDFNTRDVAVLGSGAYAIGTSVEFGWCCVNAIQSLKKQGYKTIMINYNPETVSTDYDICDKLYFEELTLERVLDIFDNENPNGVIVSMGGQIPNTLAMKLKENNVQVLGTKPENIDRAEDRHKFSSLCDTLEIDQPEWKELTSLEDAIKFSKRIGYPVLIRPSYVLSGAAMTVAFNEKELEKYLERATDLTESSVVISKFIENAKEIEIDAVACKGEIVAYAITDHVENAGVHSGDATMILPAQRIYLETFRGVRKIARELACELQITGPFNIQFIAKSNKLKVIECNLRASRSFPFVSKVYGVNFIDLATKAIMTGNVKKLDNSIFELDYVGVKAPQFSFSRLGKADPILSVEMSSTGEVACFGDDTEEAFLKSILATEFKIPKKAVLVSINGDAGKVELEPYVRKLKDAGFKVYATEGTSKFYKKNGLQNTLVYKIHEKKEPNIKTYLKEGKIDLVINIPKEFNQLEFDDTYELRRFAVDLYVPLLTNIQLAQLFINSIMNKKLEDLKIKSWTEYVDLQ
ncbi:MAG: carbamoyl-phosphate synthase (glutamine-hydrolyzing) large subunit [Candidatus Diapherotrites archaeon]